MGYPAYPEVRNSGVEWLGAIPKHWCVVRADFLTDTNRTQVLPSWLEGKEVIHFSIPNVQDFGEGIVESGDDIDSAKVLITETQILVSKLNPRKATVCLIKGKFTGLPIVASSEFVPIIPKAVSAEYAYFLWQSDKVTKLLSSNVQSVTRSHQRVNPSDVLKIFWAWPSIDEQQTIACFLGHKTAQIDALIARKQALLQKLAEKRTALISQTVTLGLEPTVPMKDSGVAWLGKMPEGWKQVSLARTIAKIEQGWSPSCEERIAASDEWGVLKSGCVNGGVFRESDHKTLPADIAPPKELEVKVGNILMCRASGSKHLIGSVATVENCRPQLIFSDKTYRITLNASLVTTKFFVLAMGSRYLRDQIELSISGADGLANNIPQSSVKAYRFLAPPLTEQQELVSSLSARLAPMAKIELSVRNAIDKLKEYRAALITAAVTGQIDVRGVPLPPSKLEEDRP